VDSRDWGVWVADGVLGGGGVAELCFGVLRVAEGVLLVNWIVLAVGGAGWCCVRWC